MNFWTKDRNPMLGLAVLGAFFALLLGLGCSNAEQAKLAGWGNRHRVSLYSGGQKVAEWETTGAVENEEHSDGFYFQEAKRGTLIRISGTVVIERE